jgi:hypothetical protein
LGWQTAGLKGFVVLFRLRESCLAVAPDVADDRDSSPDERSGTENENAVQDSHRGEDNKLTVRGEPIVRRVLKRFPCQHLIPATEGPA